MRDLASSIALFVHLLVSRAGSPIEMRCGSQGHEGSCYSGSWHDLPTGADDIRCWGRPKVAMSGQTAADDPKRAPCTSYFVSRREKRKLQWLAPPASVWVRSKRMPRVA